MSFENDAPLTVEACSSARSSLPLSAIQTCVLWSELVVTTRRPPGLNDPDVSVHGGQTFSGFCDDKAPEGFGICHRAFDGRPDRIWWFGFDCGHFMDLIPSMPQMGSGLPTGTYRTLEYVKTECTDLARQLKATQPVSDEEIREVFCQ